MHRRRHWPSPRTKGLGTPDIPAIRFARGTVFGATLVHNCYGLSGCWPPCTDLTGLPANGGFYFQAFSESVALPAAGYDYNSNWTLLLAGLSPAGMAASLAALVRPCSHAQAIEAGKGHQRLGAHQGGYRGKKAFRNAVIGGREMSLWVMNDRFAVATGSHTAWRRAWSFAVPRRRSILPMRRSSSTGLVS